MINKFNISEYLSYLCINDMDKNIIYGLFCPFLDSIHYIGQSKLGLIRPLEHLSNSHSEKINVWVDHLRLLGYAPIVKILEVCKFEELNDREKHWINMSIENGDYLLNVAHNSIGDVLSQEEYQTSEISMNRIAQTIRNSRINRGISQQQMSKITKLSRVTLSTIENGADTVTIKNLIKVLFSLNLELVVQEKTKPIEIKLTHPRTEKKKNNI